MVAWCATYDPPMGDTTAARRLFTAKLRDPAVKELAALREHADLEVRSLAVNGNRIDVVAGTSDDEWRVVLGSADFVNVQWISAIARPSPFDGVEGGHAVVVNGPSSSGKSTLLRAFARSQSVPWVIFDEPMLGEVDPGYLIWRDRSPRLHLGFLHAIAALAREGNLVALAAGGHPRSMVEAAFVEVPVLWIGLDCSASELERRERGRIDVAGGLWAASPEVHDGWMYDLRFDTEAVSVDEQVRQIAARIG
jgi:chloramphenicol 3-O phosphotransferase